MKILIIISSLSILTSHIFAASTSFPEDLRGEWALSEGSWNRYKEIADGYREPGFEERARQLLKAERKPILNGINIFKEKSYAAVKLPADEAILLKHLSHDLPLIIIGTFGGNKYCQALWGYIQLKGLLGEGSKDIDAGWDWLVRSEEENSCPITQSLFEHYLTGEERRLALYEGVQEVAESFKAKFR